MIQISVESLKEFQKRTSSLSTESTLPALKFLKLDAKGQKGYLTKNNLRCVCVMLISTIVDSPEPITIMLEEDALNKFVNHSSGTTVTITWNDTEVYLFDGKSKAYFPKEDHTSFPKTPVYNSKATKFIFRKDHLDSISIASNFILDKETGGNYRFIHLGNGYISGIHTNFFYINNRFPELPEAIIDSEISSVITAENIDVEFSSNERHYFFLMKNIIYIFTKCEGNSPNVKNIHDRLQLPGKDFIIRGDEFKSFCALSNSVSKSDLVNCTMEKVNNVLELRNVDKSYNRGCSRDLDVSGEMDRIGFDSRLIYPALNSIPHEVFRCKTNQNCLIITDEDKKEYFCFMGLAI